MPGVNWKYDSGNNSKIYWSVVNDCYIYLGQLFIDFDFKFNQTLGENTDNFRLTNIQRDFLIEGVGHRIENLLRDFKSKVPSGLTYLEKSFKGKDLKLYVSMSRNHRLIYGLIKFYDFLVCSRQTEIGLIFYAGELKET